GTFGGPIFKNKLFFFGSWDGLYERDARSNFYSVPTAALRAGDFSSKMGNFFCTDGTSFATSCSANGKTPLMATTTEGATAQVRQGMIFSPTTGTATGANRQVFSKNGVVNVLPVGIDPVAAKVLALVPQPNLPGDTNNYFVAATQRLNRNNFDGRLDWNRTEKHLIFGKFSTMRALFHGDPSLGKAI